jgi:hypothetical protein
MSSSVPRNTGRRAAVGVDHLDLAAVAHDLVHRAITQIQRAQQAVAVFFLDRAFGMTLRDRPDNLVAQGKDLAFGVGPYAEQPKDAARQRPQQRYHRRRQGNHNRHARGHPLRGRFGKGDGKGLGQQLAKDQHQHTDRKKGQRNAGITVDPRQQGGRQRG